MGKRKAWDQGAKHQQNSWAESIVETVRDVAEPLCQSENIEFVHVDALSDRGGTILRIYLDKPGGITIDDCVYMNRQLGDLLDVHLDAMGPYRLEVSSPGPKRPLTKPSDFERFKGEYAVVELVMPVDGRRRFTGCIESSDASEVVLIIDGEHRSFGFDRIKKARLSGTHGE